MEEKTKKFQTVKRIDQLPIEVRLNLEKKGIYDGLVLFEGTKNSPREITNETQSLKLPSQLLEEAFNNKN